MADEKEIEATNSMAGVPSGEVPIVSTNTATISETQPVAQKESGSDDDGSGFSRFCN